MCEIIIKVKKVEKRQPIENGRKVSYESLEYHAEAEFTARSDRKESGDLITTYGKNMFLKVQEAIDAQKKADGLSPHAPLISEESSIMAQVDGKAKVTA